MQVISEETILKNKVRRLKINLPKEELKGNLIQYLF